MQLRVKARQAVYMPHGLVENGTEYDVPDEYHENALFQVDAGHFEIVSVDEDESTGAADANEGESTETPAAGDAPAKRKGGRPKGSKNKASVPPAAPEEMTNGDGSNSSDGSDAPSGV